MIRVDRDNNGRVAQGDIFKDIEYFESYFEADGNIQISKIVFPLVIVLTQDCDLEQYFSKFSKGNQDKFLLSVIVAPLYNADHVYEGSHLSGNGLGLTMERIKKSGTRAGHIRNNEIPRYHFLEFPKDIPIPDSMIDFKHYFSVHTDYLMSRKSTQFVCKVGELFRESVCQRFAAFLSRIALPENPPL